MLSILSTFALGYIFGWYINVGFGNIKEVKSNWCQEYCELNNLEAVSIIVLPDGRMSSCKCGILTNNCGTKI